MMRNAARSASREPTLLSAPLELKGNWGAPLEGPAAIVVSRMREACLSGLSLLSDHQPGKLIIDNRSAGGAAPPPPQSQAEQPSVRLQVEQPRTAWIIVTVGERDWSRLAYQFGHELGHVLCNSWERSAAPQIPCQWIEEALVEAFSIRGLAALADEWERNVPFPGQEAFAGSIRKYRSDLVGKYRRRARELGATLDMGEFFRTHRAALEANLGVSPKTAGAVFGFLSELEQSSAYVEDMGALNRWPARSAVPVEKYLGLWEKSCLEIKTPGLLPKRLRDLLQLG